MGRFDLSQFETLVYIQPETVPYAAPTVDLVRQAYLAEKTRIRLRQERLQTEFVKSDWTGK